MQYNFINIKTKLYKRERKNIFSSSVWEFILGCSIRGNAFILGVKDYGFNPIALINYLRDGMVNVLNSKFNVLTNLRVQVPP
jgi:hypothetical protein